MRVDPNGGSGEGASCHIVKQISLDASSQGATFDAHEEGHAQVASDNTLCELVPSAVAILGRGQYLGSEGRQGHLNDLL